MVGFSTSKNYIRRKINRCGRNCVFMRFQCVATGDDIRIRGVRHGGGTGCRIEYPSCRGDRPSGGTASGGHRGDASETAEEVLQILGCCPRACAFYIWALGPAWELSPGRGENGESIQNLVWDEAEWWAEWLQICAGGESVGLCGAAVGSNCDRWCGISSFQRRQRQGYGGRFGKEAGKASEGKWEVAREGGGDQGNANVPNVGAGRSKDCPAELKHHGSEGRIGPAAGP